MYTLRVLNAPLIIPLENTCILTLHIVKYAQCKINVSYFQGQSPEFTTIDMVYLYDITVYAVAKYREIHLTSFSFVAKQVLFKRSVIGGDTHYFNIVCYICYIS